MKGKAKILMLSVAMLFAAGACQTQVSNSEKAQRQIDQLEGALGLFRFDIGRYPTTAEGLEALVRNPGIENWGGPYLEPPAIPRDPWGNDYQYRSPGEHGEYDVFSFGAKGLTEERQ